MCCWSTLFRLRRSGFCSGFFGQRFCALGKFRELRDARCGCLKRDAPEQSAAIIVEQSDSGFFVVWAAAFNPETTSSGNRFDHAGAVGFPRVETVARG